MRRIQRVSVQAGPASHPEPTAHPPAPRSPARPCWHLMSPLFVSSQFHRVAGVPKIAVE
ncbi:hypothetical protein X961_5953 [Burkholderia pseudomallei MSHR5613]|nr:hypothetical protein X989_5902 [Burkholderia pseudomallei MSHR4378]KGS38152.1 hypothetical protein X961_5953 [Burkholderia pseudomallei MSHR5613]KGX48969.1 hypothetical protein Y025_5762 [Burkholderia pseudomallei TSV32]KGX49002.1 hypothetical protein Y027_5864 [Burkholderia pseudomallei TSV5]